MDRGYKKNVVILTRPSDYRKKPEKTGLARLVYKKYPKFVKRLQTRSIAYNKMVEDIESLEKSGRIFVIRPQTPLDIGRMCHDVNKIEKAYQKGRTDALNSLNKMIEFMTMD